MALAPEGASDEETQTDADQHRGDRVGANDALKVIGDVAEIVFFEVGGAGLDGGGHGLRRGAQRAFLWGALTEALGQVLELPRNIGSHLAGAFLKGRHGILGVFEGILALLLGRRQRAAGLLGHRRRYVLRLLAVRGTALERAALR